VRYELALTEECLDPSPYFEAALAYDSANSGEHPLMRAVDLWSQALERLLTDTDVVPPSEV
jgi:hypothetical protein